MRADFDNLPEITPRHNLLHHRAFDWLFSITDVVPTSGEGDEGGSIIYVSGTTRKLYFYINGVWCDMSFTSGGTAFSDIIQDADLDTKIQVEESTDDDVIRIDSAGTEIVTADVDQFAVKSGIKLGFEGCTGDTYWKYNSVTGDLESYVNALQGLMINQTGNVAINTDKMFYFDGTEGTTSCEWNSATNYFELYVQDQLRVQF